MSHFAVLVIGSNIDEQLAPYHEFECTGQNDEYVQNVDITDEVLAQMEESEESDKLKDALSYYGLENRVVSDESDAEIDGEDAKHKYGFAVVKNGKLIKAVNRTNPNRKWDWYQVGGRWSGLLKLKPEFAKNKFPQGDKSWTNSNEADIEGYVDSAPVGQVDFKAMREEAIARREKYWAEAEAETKDTAMRYFRYGIQKDDTKESYVNRGANFSLYALVKDSKWFAKGEMGWFGMSSDDMTDEQWQEEFTKLLNDLPPETIITVVDCHI
ncbi:MAG: hypothetical protein HC840_16885 [Leptolyngbyaceae cyanobacterium RM2_2_4]|nr:hypothetical protein [Leptolyngbyaceae cyanobacterium RM2_2_4]